MGVNRYCGRVYLQGLHVRGQTGDTHKAHIIRLKDSLEVIIDGHELRGQASVGSNCDAVFTRHSEHGVTVILVLQDLG